MAPDRYGRPQARRSTEERAAHVPSSAVAAGARRVADARSRRVRRRSRATSLGLDVVGEEGDSVYLRCWGDYYAYSLVLTAAGRARARPRGLAHRSPEQLDEAVARVEAAGIQGEWIEASVGHGRAYRFIGPGGHPKEIFWEVDRAIAPAGEESPYPDRPQRAASRGIGVRILDHVTVTAPDVRAERMVPRRPRLPHHGRHRARRRARRGSSASTTLQREVPRPRASSRTFEGKPGRLHHVAFWVETNHDLTRGATFLIEHGHAIDYGPGQHGIGEQNYLYFRDPAGLRYELNSGGYRNYVPDWEPSVWRLEDGPNNSYRTEIGMPAVHMVAIPPGVVGAMTPAPAPVAAGSPEDSLSRL